MSERRGSSPRALLLFVLILSLGFFPVKPQRADPGMAGGFRDPFTNSVGAQGRFNNPQEAPDEPADGTGQSQHAMNQMREGSQARYTGEQADLGVDQASMEEAGGSEEPSETSQEGPPEFDKDPSDIPGVDQPLETQEPAASPESAELDIEEQPFAQGAVVTELLPCLLTDYIRQASSCQGGKRTISYVQARPCKDPFPVVNHTETCDCSPEDYVRLYQTDKSALTGSQCKLHYSCEENREYVEVAVDPLYCNLNGIPCSEEHVRTLYGKCDYLRDPYSGAKISETQAVEVVFYFMNECDPTAKGSISLPPSAFIPCDTSCGPGSYLKGTKCLQCPAGTYSLGGAVHYNRFFAIDPTVFKTSCLYQKPESSGSTKMTTVRCGGWYAEDMALEVGQFDYVNSWFPEECESDPAKDCHNNLKATISMDVQLVRDGFVAFNFSVNSEKGKDGLSFFVDQLEAPLMGLESYQPTPRYVKFLIPAGHHTFYWVYSKDSHFTAGEDIAVIHSIYIDGMALNALSCEYCPPGFYSKEGSFECSPCSPNTIAPMEGSANCTECGASEYAFSSPRAECKKRPACTESDYMQYFTPCAVPAHTRQERYVWASPHVCDGGVALPKWNKSAACATCPPGFEEYANLTTRAYECRLCPEGTARAADQASCAPCPAGKAAVKLWTFSHFNLRNFFMPPGMFTSCSGACGTRGWRIMGAHIDSGRHHGDGAQVFLTLQVLMEMDGTVWFNYTVDMSAGDKTRGFFFYIDDNIMDFVQDSEGGNIHADTLRSSGPWLVTKGNHTLMWEWMRISGDAPPNARDNVIIYDIVVRGVTDGAAPGCEGVPGGMGFFNGSKTIDLCPAGTFSPGGSGDCTKCQDNTFSTPGSSSCTLCGAGTTSKGGDPDCFIGEAADEASFCTYYDTSNAPTSFDNVTQPIRYYFFDLQPLNAHSRTHPFGPIVGTGPSHGTYYLSVCGRNTKGLCHDLDGKDLESFACMVQADEALLVGHKPSVDLGRVMSIHSLSEYGKELTGRGIVLAFTGEKCAKTGQPSTLNVTLICDPKAGYGMPSAWTGEGKKAAFDPSRQFPHWVERGNSTLPVADTETCHHDLVWYSSFGCPECGWEDYEEVRVNDCKDNKLYTYRWKANKACLPTERAQLPQDIMCQPCTQVDYSVTTGECTDSEGRQNVTYAWRQPKLCNEHADGAVPLPQGVRAGQCAQVFIYLPSDVLSPKYVFVFASLGVLLVVMLVVALVAWIKHRRIQKFYSKLVEAENSTEMADMDERHEREDEAHGEERPLN